MLIIMLYDRPSLLQAPLLDILENKQQSRIHLVSLTVLIYRHILAKICRHVSLAHGNTSRYGVYLPPALQNTQISSGSAQHRLNELFKRSYFDTHLPMVERWGGPLSKGRKATVKM